MILADTSVWVDHFRGVDPTLESLLREEQILGHPFVVVELALCSLRQRHVIIGALHRLPQAIVATNVEVLRLIDRERLFGQGIGFVDAHLLAATRLTPNALLWTRDKRLMAAAKQLSVAASLTHRTQR